MMITRLGIVLILALYISISLGMAQETAVSAGGDITGNGGTVSFSIGQVFYSSHSGTSGEVFQGIQIPYEITVVTSVDDAKEINLMLKVYPNPTSDLLTLSLEGIEPNELVYYLFDISGQLIQNTKIVGLETTISMGNLTPKVYFLKVLKEGREIKTFKIVKN